MPFIKKTLNYAAFSAAATTGTATVYTAKADCLVGRAIVLVDTAMSGGSVSACNVGFGKTSGTGMLANTDVFTGSTVDVFANTAVANTAYVALARGTSVVATMTASHNTNTLNAGVMTVWLDVQPLEKKQN